jgi:hypothetical protein
MTLAAEQGKAAKELDYLLEIEIGHRVDAFTWFDEGGGVFSIAYPYGMVSKVRACELATHIITTYDEVSDIFASGNSMWFFDPDSSVPTLYVHTSTGADPGGGDFYICAYFRECLCNGQREGAQALYNNGVWYLPYLDESSIPDVSLEVSMFSDGGIRLSFGTISLLNADGYFDSRIADYIYSGKQAVLKVGAPEDTYAQFVTLWRGWTGNLTWSDERLAIDTEDERKIAE